MAFLKGKSGNPGGIPSEIKMKIGELKRIAIDSCPKAFKALVDRVELINPAMMDKIDVAVIKEVLDRGMGKAAQQINIESTDSSFNPAEMTKEELFKKIAYIEELLQNSKSSLTNEHGKE